MFLSIVFCAYFADAKGYIINKEKSTTIKICFVSAGFSADENNDEMKTLETSKSVPDDMMKEDCEACMAINDIIIVGKLIETDLSKCLLSNRK